MSAYRILFIEDQDAFAVGVIDRLTAEGYDVARARAGDEGYERAKKGEFDLIVLDVMLPGKSGFDICRDLRRDGVIQPILMLTARGEIADRVVGLKLGADDYLVKPFDPLELLARIEALLRRVSGQPVKSAEIFEFGDIRVDVRNNSVIRNQEPVSLSRGEYRLLRYLLEHRGSTISREELFEKVWGMESDTMSRTVDVHVASLRKKIEPDPRFPQYILTVKGFGYRMVV